MTKMTRKGISLNAPLVGVVDLLLTPRGFFAPPKGSYSLLVNSLLTTHLEQHFKVDILHILSAYEQVGADREKLEKYLATLKV